jgi:hypothetical protein
MACYSLVDSRASLLGALFVDELAAKKLSRWEERYAEGELVYHMDSFQFDYMYSLCVAEIDRSLSMVAKDLVVVILSPAYIRSKATESPLSIHSTETHGGFPMRMAGVQDLLQLIIRVLLMRHPHLVVGDYLVCSRLRPLSSSDEVLRLDALVAQEVRV